MADSSVVETKPEGGKNLFGFGRNPDRYELAVPQAPTLNDLDVPHIPYEEGRKQMHDKWNRHLAFNITVYLIVHFLVSLLFIYSIY